ncbi:hypothetical protein EVAR_78785_1 [Eumeta japonica]|uniref:Uncharacterized protein n=1 Tax=Eumeta variegata TaxID=151549 RepID=A0A4C1T264_EUMVA|nr:hypothetical protein EVAR_78785_1 [Eumeta japonica]
MFVMLLVPALLTSTSIRPKCSVADDGPRRVVRARRPRSPGLTPDSLALALHLPQPLNVPPSLDPGFSQIRTRTDSRIRMESWTESEIEKEARIRFKSVTGTKIENGTGVENNCGGGIRIKSVTALSIKVLIFYNKSCPLPPAR